jgi:hypothetical protein
MDDAALCEDLRQAIGRLEHPSAFEPKALSILNRLDDISQELYDAGHTGLAEQINVLFHKVEAALRGTK